MGGILGLGVSGIELCANYGRIRGFRWVGGIAGANHGSISNCYNVGDIICTKNGECFGGISGVQNASSESIYSINCYNIGNIVKGESTGSYYGAIIGMNNCKVQNCYYLDGTYDGGCQGLDTLGKAQFLTSDYMKTIAFVDTLGNTNFKIVDGVNGNYPIFNWQEGIAITESKQVLFYNYLPLENQSGKAQPYQNNINPIKLYNNDVQYGPYVNLNAGKYKVTYIGKNLDLAKTSDFLAYSVDAGIGYTITFSTFTSEKIEYTFSLDEDTIGVETAINHPALADGQYIEIRYIQIEKIE